MLLSSCIVIANLLVLTHAFVRVDTSAKPVPQVRVYFSSKSSHAKMVDESNRQLLFHGVNVVYKIPPYYPQLEGFDPEVSLCDEDMQFLRDNGLNVVRLMVSWAGTEIVPGIYNYTYINVLRDIVERLAYYNISTILDCHQACSCALP